MFLTKCSKFVEQLDHSYSHAHRVLDGIQITVEGLTRTFNATLSSGSSQRLALRKEAQQQQQQLAVDPEDAANLKKLNVMDMIAKKAKTFEKAQMRKRAKKN